MHSALWRDRIGQVLPAGHAEGEFPDLPTLRDARASGFLSAVCSE